MGRPKKFGEKSRFVSVRVPGSKVSEYREAIKKLVNEKFTRDSSELNKAGENKEPYEKETVTFRDFLEFGKDVGEGDLSKNGGEENFFMEIVKEIDKRGKNGKEIKL